MVIVTSVVYIAQIVKLSDKCPVYSQQWNSIRKVLRKRWIHKIL